MTRAVLGTILGSLLTLVLLLAVPQPIQRALALGGDNAWPAAIVISGLVGYVAGFLGNRGRPQRWHAAAIWVGGCLIAALMLLTGIALFTSPDS